MDLELPSNKAKYQYHVDMALFIYTYLQPQQFRKSKALQNILFVKMELARVQIRFTWRNCNHRDWRASLITIKNGGLVMMLSGSF